MGLSAIEERRFACLMGTYVADAASLGLHWLYDVERLAEVAGERPEFHEPNAADYEGVSGFFVQGHKQVGDLTQYSSLTRLMVDTLLADGGELRVRSFQGAFVGFFGPGGAWHGYLSRGEKGTLANLAASGGNPPAASGTADQQIPAVGTVPALVAAGPGREDLLERVEAAVRVTNNNDVAVDYARGAATLLRVALDGAPVRDAWAAMREVVDPATQERIDVGLTLDDPDPVSAIGALGRACALPSAVPAVAYLSTRCGSFAEAARANILAGGNNCGRAVLLGPLLGAVHGIGGERGIPYDWLVRLSDLRALTASSLALARL